MPKNTPAPNERLWSREVKRIRQFLRRAEKRGFTFDVKLPEKPARITKKVLEKIRNIRPENLYKKARYTDPITGATVSGEQGRAVERSRAAAKSAATVARREGRFVRPTALEPAETQEIGKEYRKQVNRIKNAMRRMEKRGFTFFDRESVIPQEPGIITIQEVEALKAITPETLYPQTFWTEPNTNIRWGGLAGLERQQEYLRAQDEARRFTQTRELLDTFEAESQGKAYLDDNIIENLREKLSTYEPSTYYNEWFREKKKRDVATLSRMFEGAIAREGEEEISIRLNRVATEVNRNFDSVMNESEQEAIQTALTELANILNNGPVDMQISRDLGDLSDYFNGV